MKSRTLDAYFRIFSEGAGDEDARRRARDVYSRTLEALGDVKPNEMDTPTSGVLAAAVNIGEILGDPDLMDLELRFVMKTAKIPAGRRAMFLGSKTKEGRRIEIYVEVPSNVQSDMTSDVWKRTIAKNAQKVFQRLGDIFDHEFVHYLDFKKMTPASRAKTFGKVPKSGSRSPETYYNDPVEFNAFVQQGLSRIERHIEQLDSPEKVKRLLGPTADAFYKSVLGVFPPKFAKLINDPFKAKLKKRVAQMWITATKNSVKKV